LIDIIVLFELLEATLIKDKLEQLGTWQLFGNVTCMKPVRLVGTDRDSLLLSFQEAKVNNIHVFCTLLNLLFILLIKF